MSILHNVADRNISSVSSVTLGGALRAVCSDVYMCIDTHLPREIFSREIFFILFYLFLENSKSMIEYNNVN